MRRSNKKRRSGHSDHDNKKKKKIEKKCRCSYVPEEIQRQILLRLPVKSLLRFLSLNKRSNNLISTQQFISDHLITFQHENERLFLLFSPGCFNRYLQYVDGSVRPEYVQDLAPPPIGPIGEDVFRVVDYCDGVICMIHSSCSSCLVQLWNPSIKKTTLVVSRSFPCRSEFWYLNGNIFGFGSVDGEHKLVVLPTADCSLSAHVFSLKTQNWATVQRHQYCTVTRERSRFVNGACHWLARDGGIFFVLLFNLKEHTFGKIDLPDYLGPPFSLSVNHGRLSLIARVEQSDRRLVWVMTKYGVVESWTRVMENKNLRYLQDIVGIRGGDVFGLAYCWFEDFKPKLVCYKPGGQRAEWLNADVKNFTQLHVYRESLMLLNQGALGGLV